MGRRKASEGSYEELIDLIVVDYLSGMSRGKLAKKYDRSKWTITHWLQKKGVDIRDSVEESRLHNIENNVRRIEIDEDQLRHLYLDLLWSPERIARSFGVWTSVIRDRLVLFGIERTVEQEKGALEVSNNLRKETCRQRYGGDSPNADPDVRARTAATNLAQYGHENPFGGKSIQEKIKETNLRLYGVENPLLDPQRAAAVGRGVSAAARAKWSAEAQLALSSKEALLAYMVETKRDTVPLLTDALKVSAEAVYACLTSYELWESLDTSYHNSVWEREVGDTIKSWGVFIEKTRKVLPSKREIDWYSSDYNIGIECNGSWTHCEYRKTDRKYHLKKTQEAQDVGVFLYHIFEYEWKNPRQRPIIESQLRNLFGLSSRKLGARQCEIREVSPTDGTDFLEENHLQGRVGSSLRYGLYFQNELVALMTFGRPREQKKAYAVEWELARYAVKQNTSVSGGASRLFQHFVKQHSPSSVVSYSDMAKTRGGLYPSLGFEFVNDSGVEYVWWKGKEVLRRYQCMVHKLRVKYAGIFPDIDNMSEADIMHAMGYQRIYGCGNKVWVWKVLENEEAA